MKLTIAKLIMKWLGMEGVAIERFDPAVIASAKEIIDQLESKQASGEYKRGKAVAAMVNRHPEVRASRLSLLVELVLCGAV